MGGLMRFDAEGDPSIDPGDGWEGGTPTPLEAWGTGAGDESEHEFDQAVAPAELDPTAGVVEDEGPGEGPWDVFWGRQAPGTHTDPWSDELLAPEPVLGADDTPLSGAVEVDEADAGASEGEMDAGPV